jgi:hypothetical protein
MPLTKEQILAAQDLPLQTVQVPEWGGEVTVRAMTGRERGEFDDKVSKMKDGTWGMRVALLARTLCDEQGNPMFTDAEVEQLGAKSAAALARVEAIATEINGYRRDEVEKNSEGGQDA